MNSFRAFIQKEFRHILRDRRTMLILFGMPIIQMVLFGFAIRNEIRDAKIAIWDQSHDYLSRELTTKLLSSGYFIAVHDVETLEDVHAAFRKGLIKEAVVIEPGFAERLLRDGSASIQLIADAADPNVARLVISYTQAIVQDFQREQLDGTSAAPVQVDVRLLYNPELKSVVLFVPGLIALLMMLVSALMTSITITREKEMGTMEVLLVSPLRPVQIVVGKVIPYLVLSFINVTTILVLAQTVFGVPFRGSYILFYAESLIFVTTALALGVMISTISPNQQTAMMIALSGLMLPVIILSGFIFPVTSMPLPLQYFSHVVPAKWYLVIVKGVMLKGVGLDVLWKETAILAGMALFFLLVSFKRLKVRLE
jgi:ABC-2 type transport system permease protein